MPSVLEVEDLKTYFPVRKGLLRRTVGHVHAVDGVSFAIAAGETLGLVGESGCGKTTTARLVLCLERPSGGGIFFRGQDVHGLRRAERGAYRRAVQAVFQDPYSSLNPRMSVSQILAEPLKVHGIVPRRAERRQRVDNRVLDPAAGPPHASFCPPRRLTDGAWQCSTPSACGSAIV